MTPDLLVCPGCRTRTGDRTGDRAGDRIDVRTLARRGDELACECGRTYPIFDGVPVVLADPTAHQRGELATVIERDLGPAGIALRAGDGPDEAVVPRLVEHLSVYLDAHWGDRAEPPPDGPGAGFAMAALVERLRARVDRVALAVDLGCSVGRGVAELAASADHVVGLDLQLAAVRRARRLLGGERLAYGRRVNGRHYAPAHARAGDRVVPPDRTTLLCGDALDPPLVPGGFGRVVALNLLDAVPHPRQLIAVLDGLCAPGGEVILASPYAWNSAIVDDAERLGGADPAAEVTAIFRDGRGLAAPYRIEDEAALPWTLRRDTRTAVAYWIHYIRVRKMAV